MLTEVRNKAAEALLKRVFKHIIGDIASIDKVRIDTQAHRFELTLLLCGEVTPMKVSGHYGMTAWKQDCARSVGQEATVALICSRLQADKAWADAVLRRFAEGKPIPIPARFTGIVKRLLAIEFSV